MRTKCVRLSVVVLPRHAKLASHRLMDDRDARCAHRTWAGRLSGTMTQNDLFRSGNFVCGSGVVIFGLWGRFQIVSQR